MELSPSQSSAPPGTGSAPLREQSTPCCRHMALSRERYRTKRQIEPFTNGHKNGGGALFDNHPRCKNKEFLLDITIGNPCASANLENAARYTGNNLANAAERKKTNLRG